MTKKNKRKKKGFTLPLAPIVGLAAGFVGPMGDSPLEYAQKGDFRSMFVRLGKSYVGYDANSGKMDLKQMSAGVVPLFVGLGVHIVASKLGFNRLLGQAGVPIIRI